MPQSNAFICILLASLFAGDGSCSMNDAYQLFSEGNLIDNFGNFAEDGGRRRVHLATPDPPLPYGYNRHEA
jgi:hypothetical protein